MSFWISAPTWFPRNIFEKSIALKKWIFLILCISICSRLEIQEGRTEKKKKESSFINTHQLLLSMRVSTHQALRSYFRFLDNHQSPWRCSWTLLWVNSNTSSWLMCIFVRPSPKHENRLLCHHYHLERSNRKIKIRSEFYSSRQMYWRSV